MTLPQMHDKYDRLLNQCGPGEPERGYLLEEMLDDLETLIVPEDGESLKTLTGMAYQRGYKDAINAMRRAMRPLPYCADMVEVR